MITKQNKQMSEVDYRKHKHGTLKWETYASLCGLNIVKVAH